MIEKIDISGNNFEIKEDFKKYVEKRLGKLEKYLPKEAKKEVVMKVVVTGSERAHGTDYNLSVAMEIPGGKVIAAKDECTNVFAGVDIVEAKLAGQIRRYKLDLNPHMKKKSFKNLFIKRK